MPRKLLTALISLCLVALAPSPAAAGGSPKGERTDTKTGYGRRVAACAVRWDWRRIGDRANLIQCIARQFSPPGTPLQVVHLAYCESGPDYQDTSPGYIGTFQHISSAYHGRWLRWGHPTGVPPTPTNVLGQAVVSVRMAKAASGWRQWPGCARRVGLPL